MFFGGGMLTGSEILKQYNKGNIDIYPFNEDQINPNSYNLKLAPQLLVYKRGSDRINLLPGNEDISKTTQRSNSFGGINDAKIVPLNKVEEPVKLYDTVVKSDDVAEYLDRKNIEIRTPKLLTEESSREIFAEEINRKQNSIPTLESVALAPIDMHQNNETIEFEIPKEGYVLQPGILYIGRTIERTHTDKFIPMINGRSSGGRLGISIHICAGFGDIGFDGSWTLEITCVEPVRIYPGEEVAQICYFKPYGKIKNEYLYHGRYQGQIDATASRFFKGKLK